MTWCDIQGHDRVADYFRHALQQRRLASTFLFLGPAGIGKRLFSLRLAQTLLCEASAEALLAPCRACDACVQVEAGTHPDVELISRPPEKSFIPLELFIGSRDQRGRAGLCYWISRKPSSGRRRIAVIDDADYLNQEGANSLLKTLEEPPPRSVLILIGTSEQRQLPTIRSRCQIVRFSPLSNEIVTQLLQSRQGVADAAEASRLAELCDGSLERAMQLNDAELTSFYRDYADRWQTGRLDPPALAKDLQTFVNSAGSDAPVRRRRLQYVIELMLRDLQRRRDDQLAQAPSSAWRTQASTMERTGEQIERCLTALQEIEANANLATLIECWVDDLQQRERAD